MKSKLACFLQSFTAKMGIFIPFSPEVMHIINRGKYEPVYNFTPVLLLDTSHSS